MRRFCSFCILLVCLNIGEAAAQNSKVSSVLDVSEFVKDWERFIAASVLVPG